jgi:cobalt-zinc-cadmium efflux system protein
MHSHEHHNHEHHSHENAFRYGILLNVALVIAQVWAGLRSESVSLIADAWHNFGDVLGLILAWIAIKLAARPPTDRFTYGLKSSTTWAALFNSSSLLFLSGALSWESIRRLENAPLIDTSLVIPFALLGILINGLSAIPFFKSKDLNIRSAFWHLVSDALISTLVLIGAVLQHKTNLSWIDPAVSIVICLVIAWGSIRLLKDAWLLSMHAVPSHLETAEVRKRILQSPGVEGIHGLHIWALGTSDTALTCHLLTKKGASPMDVLRALELMLEKDFGIDHITIQFEEKDSFKGCKINHTQSI